MSEKLSEKDEKFAFAFLAERAAYHNHKEQMAYVGFLVQTAFFTAIMTFNWDLNNKVFHILVIILSVVFWILIYIFLRWQLRLRRYAALQHDTVMKALLNNIKDVEENKEESVSSTDKEFDLNTRKSRWLSFIDNFIWPCPSSPIQADIKIVEYPNWYQREFHAQFVKGTGASRGEKLVTLGSWFILLGIVMRFTLLSCS